MPSLKVFHDPLIAGRMVSVAAGLLSLAGIAALTFVLTNNLFLASLSSLLYSVLPFSVFFDRMALADSLLSAFGLWSLALGALLIKKTRLDLALLLGFSTGLGLITKSPAIFFYLWQPILLLALFDFHSKDRIHRLMKLAGAWLVAIVVSQGIYNILRLGTNFNLIGSRNQDYLFSLKEVFTHPTNPLFGNLTNTFKWLWYLLTPPLFLSIFVSFLGRYRKISFWIILLSLFALVSQAFVAKVYTSRYLLFGVTPLILPISFGISYLSERFGRWISLIFLGLFIWPIFLSVFLVFNPIQAKLPFDMRSGYLEEWTAGWGQKEIANYLNTRSTEGKKLIVGTDGYFGTLPDGLQIYTQANPVINVLGGNPSVTSIPDSLANSLLDKNNLVFLVANASRLKLSAVDQSRLVLIKRYDKPERLDGTHESLLFYQLTH